MSFSNICVDEFPVPSSLLAVGGSVAPLAAAEEITISTINDLAMKNRNIIGARMGKAVPQLSKWSNSIRMGTSHSTNLLNSTNLRKSMKPPKTRIPVRQLNQSW